MCTSPCRDLIDLRQFTFAKMDSVFSRCRNGSPVSDWKKIVRYLKGHSQLEELGISAENAEKFFQLSRLIDLSLALQYRYSTSIRSKTVLTSYRTRIKFQKSTYLIRALILNLCPLMKSTEVFKAKEQENVPERTGVYAKIIANEAVLAFSLSKKLLSMILQPTERFSVLLTRGNTASGKTTCLLELFKGSISDSGIIPGSLNPDTFKVALKRNPFTHNQYSRTLKQGYTNLQIHEEGKMLFSKFREEMSKRLKCMIIDMRFESVISIREVINPIIKLNGKIHLIDLDVQLLTSISRVLIRDPYGKDPCTKLEVIVDGYLKIRKNRAELVDFIKRCEFISHYQLFYLDEAGVKKMIAEKLNMIFKVYHKHAFVASMRIPNRDEINEIIKKVINLEFVEAAIKRKDIQIAQRDLLDRWAGKSIVEAFKIHTGI